MHKPLFQIFIVFILVSCGGGSDKQELPYNQHETKQTLARILNYLDKHYVEDVNDRDIIIAGLDSLYEDVAAPIPPKISQTQNHNILVHDAIKNISRNMVKSDRLKEMTNGEVQEKFFDGLFDTLDKHSSYMTPREGQLLTQNLLGFGGIGVGLSSKETGLFIEEVMDDMPAKEVGLTKGDLITHVDGYPITKEEYILILSKIRGKAGTKVTLSIDREGQRFDVHLTRRRMDGGMFKTSIQKYGKKKIGVVEFSSFNVHAPSKLIKAIMNFKDQSIDGLIVDLRDNPGGLMPIAIGIASMFVEDGLITQTKGREEGTSRKYPDIKGQFSPDLPLAILINGGSASASEIFSAAMKDHKRAQIFGSTTYGKGSVQSNMPLPNGGKVSVTISEFFSPHGHKLNEIGVEPHVCTTTKKQGRCEKNMERQDSDMQKALKYLASQ